MDLQMLWHFHLVFLRVLHGEVEPEPEIWKGRLIKFSQSVLNFFKEI